MGVEIFGIINGINVYIDDYMEDNKILKGKKQGVLGNTFMIANTKTAKQMYNIFIMKQRKDKINQIKNKIWIRKV